MIGRRGQAALLAAAVGIGLAVPAAVAGDDPPRDVERDASIPGVETGGCEFGDHLLGFLEDGLGDRLLEGLEDFDPEEALGNLEELLEGAFGDGPPGPGGFPGDGGRLEELLGGLLDPESGFAFDFDLRPHPPGPGVERGVIEWTEGLIEWLESHGAPFEVIEVPLVLVDAPESVELYRRYLFERGPRPDQAGGGSDLAGGSLFGDSGLGDCFGELFRGERPGRPRPRR